jgi:hypothetical protein
MARPDHWSDGICHCLTPKAQFANFKIRRVDRKICPRLRDSQKASRRLVLVALPATWGQRSLRDAWSFLHYLTEDRTGDDPKRGMHEMVNNIEWDVLTLINSIGTAYMKSASSTSPRNPRPLMHTLWRTKAAKILVSDQSRMISPCW